MMDTKGIISWLRDKAARAGDLSWQRMMKLAADRLQQLSEKQTPCPACKGTGYITLTRKYDDYCGIGSEVCTNCDGTGMLKTAVSRADRFRSMSDDELVTLAVKQIGCGYNYIPCGTVCNGKCECNSSDECRAKILKWLKQPAEVSECSE